LVTNGRFIILYPRGETNEINCRRVDGCNSTQSPREFLEKIMIRTYFHGSNVNLVWFWEKENHKGENHKTWKKYYIILYLEVYAKK
jgi:hypothetical protein